MGLKSNKKKSPGSNKKVVRRKRRTKAEMAAAASKEFLELKYRFKNNDEKWMTLVLSETTLLLESYKIIEKDLQEIFGDDVKYFLPIYIEKTNNNVVGFQLFEGYVFVKQSEISRVEVFTKKTEHLDKVLYRGSNPYFVTNRDINKFKTKLKLELVKRLPRKGSRVLVNDGTFKNQEGIVLSVNKREKTAIVEFHKRTRVVSAKLSVVSFEVKRKDE